jgi:hypothetical protein
MLRSHRKKLVAVIATLVVVIGAGAAIGATGALSPKQESDAVVNDAAKELGVQPSELTAALKTALKNRVDAAVTAGRLTEAQGKAMKARIDAGGVPLFGLGGGGPHHGVRGVHAGLDAAASYLGLTQANLRSALEGGKTLAQVAQAQSKSVDGLIAAMVAGAKQDLADAVKAGRLTQAQSTAMQADLKARITDLVNNGRPAGPRLGPGPGFGPPTASFESGVAAA